MKNLMIRFSLLLGVAGCASDSHDDHFDSLWKQGYGYNNPNVDRIRTGQKPTGFGD